MKKHIPVPGRCTPKSGPAICGRWCTYPTGDHDAIRREGLRALEDGDDRFCARCLAALRRELDR